MKPSFSISILISSPALSQFLVITAEPAGVPVGIKSPGSSVKAVDKYSTNVKQSKIKSLVEADCLNSPFTLFQALGHVGCQLHHWLQYRDQMDNECPMTFP